MPLQPRLHVNGRSTDIVIPARKYSNPANEITVIISVREYEEFRKMQTMIFDNYILC